MRIPTKLPFWLVSDKYGSNRLFIIVRKEPYRGSKSGWNALADIWWGYSVTEGTWRFGLKQDYESYSEFEDGSTSFLLDDIKKARPATTKEKKVGRAILEKWQDRLAVETMADKL
jgi:hypothetical protein